MPPTVAELWQLLPWGYLLTITLETPVLLFGLSARHSWQRRLFAGVWLTACTYPIVGIFLPLTVWPQFGYVAYLVVAEIFAPVAECAVFLLAFPDERQTTLERVRDCVAIVVANLVSFILGGYLFAQMQT
jgi:hypothetical protein